MTSQPALADGERYKELVHPPRPSTTVPVRIRMSDAYAPLLQADGTALRVCGDMNAGLTQQASDDSDMTATPVGSSVTPDRCGGGCEVPINYVIDNGLSASMQSTYLMPVKAEIAPGPGEYEIPCPVAIDQPATAGVHGGGGRHADQGAPASVGLDKDTDTQPLPPPRSTDTQAVQMYEYSATIVAHPVATARARTLRSASDSATEAASRSRSETQTSEPAKLPADYLTIVDSCSLRDSSQRHMGVADP